MLTIDKVHDRIDFLIKKNKWGYISPQQKDLAIDLAQMELFNEYYGDPNKYQYGRPIPPVAYGQTQKLLDSLTPFLKTLGLDNPDGFTPFPDDYVHLDSAFLKDGRTTPTVYTPLILKTNDKVAFKRNSQLRPLTDLKNAFIAIIPDPSNNSIGIQIYPSESLPSGIEAIAYYLSRPVPPVYAYTQSKRIITYNEAASTQLKWRDDDIINKIIPKAVEYIGINLGDNLLFQEGQIKDKD